MANTNTSDSRRMLNATAISRPTMTRSRRDAVINDERVRTRSSHQISAATAAACGYSDSSESAWTSSNGTVPTTSVITSAGTRPIRRRTTPWTSTSHTQKQTTMTIFSRS